MSYKNAKNENGFSIIASNNSKEITIKDMSMNIFRGFQLRDEEATIILDIGKSSRQTQLS
jgi:hypothetical protein